MRAGCNSSCLHLKKEVTLPVFLYAPASPFDAVAAAKATSRYGAPHMEGPFNENPDEDCSLDPVGQVSAVRALAIIFRGQKIDEMKLREQISEGNLPEFRMVEIAIFSTVVRRGRGGIMASH